MEEFDTGNLIRPEPVAIVFLQYMNSHAQAEFWWIKSARKRQMLSQLSKVIYSPQQQSQSLAANPKYSTQAKKSGSPAFNQSILTDSAALKG